MLLKINLGSENNILNEFENLDPRWKLFSGVKPWDGWNSKIPYGDGSAELVLVQHVLMYCKKEDYDRNLQEIYRILCPGGIFLLKEENDKKYQWRKIGTKHKTGNIIGSTNLEEIVPILEKNGFKIISTDSKTITEKYNKNYPIINRLPKLFKDKLFIVECQK
jgi:ubiquinone/menaquinone biosynthesis C-methylase UbiE